MSTVYQGHRPIRVVWSVKNAEFIRLNAAPILAARRVRVKCETPVSTMIEGAEKFMVRSIAAQVAN
jgi:hypothetical protein